MKVVVLAVALSVVGVIPDLKAQGPPEHAVSRDYNRSLGVECEHCHVANQFADASKPTFEFARRMGRMVRALNDGPLKDMGSISLNVTKTQAARASARATRS